MNRVAVLALGRSGGMGEERRVASWRSILTSAGVDVTTVLLLQDARGLPAPSTVAAIAAGTAVPEAAAWSIGRARAALRRAEPDAVVAVTVRAFHPGLEEAGGPVLLDFVDRLSVSYADRAAVATALPRRALFRSLAVAHRRAERRLRGPGRAAAGWADARTLGAQWIPNVVAETAVVDRAAADVDLVFFGNLSYAPNIAAVDRLARVWPAILRERPGTTALIAGARPAPPVVAAATVHGWELAADFPDLATLLRRARLAVAPLVHTAGIQNKVLEAAAFGLPQVVSAEAAAGLDPEFPVTVAATDEELSGQIVALLDDASRRATEGAAAAAHVAARYSARAWAPRALELLSREPARGRRP